ncbi:MAG TPA: hypothetical protein VGN00_30060 [Puia sp.]|jgi:hypothetical protein
MLPKTVHEVAVKDLDRLNHHLTEIKDTVATLKSQKKPDLTAIAALIVSVIALVATLVSDARNTDQQRVTQAYSNWRDYLSVAVSNPQLANGYDTICERPVAWYSDPNNKMARKLDKKADTLYTRYAWFVTYALTSAENVYTLESADKAWKNAVIEALKPHKTFIIAKEFDRTGYDSSFIHTLVDSLK